MSRIKSGPAAQVRKKIPTSYLIIPIPISEISLMYCRVYNNIYKRFRTANPLADRTGLPGAEW